jgi:hypothetical protein
MNGAATLELPDDPTLLKQIIAQQHDALEQRDSALALCDLHIEQIKREAAQTIEAMQLRHKAEMDAVLRRFYGPKSEKFDPRQLLIFGIAVADQIPVDEKAVEGPNRARSWRLAACGTSMAGASSPGRCRAPRSFMT